MGHLLAICLLFISFFGTMMGIKLDRIFNPAEVLGPPRPNHSQSATRPEYTKPTVPPTTPTEPFQPIPETDIIQLFTPEALSGRPESLSKETKEQLLRELDAAMKKKKNFDKEDKAILRTCMERIMESYPTYQALYSFLDVPDAETFLREYFIAPLRFVDDIRTRDSVNRPASFLYNDIRILEQPLNDDMQAAAVMHGLWTAAVQNGNPINDRKLYKALMHSGASHMQLLLAGSDYYPNMGSVSVSSFECADPLNTLYGYTLGFSDSGNLYPVRGSMSSWMWNRLYTLTDFQTMTLFLQPHGERLIKQELIDRYGDDGKEFYRYISTCAERDTIDGNFTTHADMEELYLRLLASRVQEVESPQEMLAFLQMYRVLRLGMSSEYGINSILTGNDHRETMNHYQLDYTSVDMAVADGVYDWHILNAEGFTEEQEYALAYAVSAVPSNTGKDEYKMTHDSVDSEPLLCMDYRYSMKMTERDNIWFYFKYTVDEQEHSVLRHYYFDAGKCYNFDHAAVEPPMDNDEPFYPSGNPSHEDAIPLLSEKVLSNIPTVINQQAQDRLFQELDALLTEKQFNKEAENRIRESMEILIESYPAFELMHSYWGAPDAETYLRTYFIAPLRTIRNIKCITESTNTQKYITYDEASDSLCIYSDSQWHLNTNIEAARLVNMLWNVAVAQKNPYSSEKGFLYNTLRNGSGPYMQLAIAGSEYYYRLANFSNAGMSIKDPANLDHYLSYGFTGSLINSGGNSWKTHRLLTLLDFDSIAAIMEPNGELLLKDALIDRYGKDGKKFYNIMFPDNPSKNPPDSFDNLVELESLYIRMLKIRLEAVKSQQEMLSVMQMYRITRLTYSPQYVHSQGYNTESVFNPKLDYSDLDRAIAEAVVEWDILNAEELTQEQEYALAYSLITYPVNSGFEEYLNTNHKVNFEAAMLTEITYSMEKMDQDRIRFYLFFEGSFEEMVYGVRDYNFKTGECYNLKM